MSLPDKRRGTLSGGTGRGKFRRTAEAPCVKVQAQDSENLSPTLGIAGEKPQHSEDL